MTKDHRKNIRRLLKGGEAPIPPHDLKAKLKNDIPESFRASGGRAPSRWGRDVWLIAATLILIVGTSLVALRTIEMAEQERSESFAVDVAAGGRSQEVQFLDATEPAPVDQGRREYPQEIAAPNETDAARGEESKAPTLSTMKESFSPVSVSRFGNKDDSDSGVATRIEEQRAEDAPARAAIASKPELERARKVATPQAAPVTGADRMEQAQVRSLADELSEADVTGGVSDLRLDEERVSSKALPLQAGRDSVDAVRRSLTAGRLPSPNSVRVAELVNYFAPTAAAPPAGDFSIHVDGGPMPLAFDRSGIMLHFEIRAREGADREVIASDLVVNIALNSDVVAEYRLLGLDGAPAEASSETTVRAAETLSVLYEVRLRSMQDRRAQIGTLALRWTGPDGQSHQLREPVFISHLSSEWRYSSPSLKIATIVAQWAEYLSGTDVTNREDLARLSTLLDAMVTGQVPSDRIRELQTLIAATATARRSDQH